MVEKIFKFLNREFNGLHEAAFLLGGSAIASQLLALARDRLLAATFGASRDLDIYYAAFRLPDLIYVSIGSLVSVTIILPFLIKHREGGDYVSSAKLINSLLTVFLLTMLVVTGLAFFLIPILTPLLAPGFEPNAVATLISLSRLLLLSPILLGLSNLLGGVTQSLKRFALYALSPVVYNIGIIIGIVWLAPRWGLKGLAVGVILGAVFHVLIQLPALARAKWWPHLTSRIAWKELAQIALVALPRTIALSAQQLVIFVLVSLASLMAAGSIAVFNFAYNLQAVPLTVVGVSYSVAAFPTLIRSLVGGDRKAFVTQVSNAVRHIIFWSVPATALFVVLRAQVVRVVLGSGEFDWSDTRLTAAALALFIISAVAQSLILLFVRAYYAAGQTKKPLVINLFSALVTVALAIGLHFALRFFPTFDSTLGQELRVAEVAGRELLALPLAFSLGSLLNFGLFVYFFRRDFGDLISIRRVVSEVVLASVAIGVMAYTALQFLARVFDLDTFSGIFLQGLIAGLLGIGAGVAVLHWLGNHEILEFKRSLTKRLWREVKTVMPEPTEL